MSMAYDSPFWLTFHQVYELGGGVRRDEKSCPVLFWRQKKIIDEETGEERNVPLLRLYHVFNVAQCEGIETIPSNIVDPIVVTKPAELVEKMPRRPKIKHGMTHSCYSPHEDCVSLPLRKQFDKEEEYYSTLFHELVHSTGHPSRLNRRTLTEKAGFGSDPYCREELIAEMGAAYLCAQAEIVERTITNSAAYIRGWIEKLKSDNTLVLQAAAQAQRASDFILGTLPPPLIGGSVENAPQPEPMEAAA